MREALAIEGEVGGLGVGGAGSVGEEGGLVGGVGFEEELAGEGGGGDAGGALVAGIGERAAEGDADAAGVEGGEEVGGAGVGVEENAGGVRGTGEEVGEDMRPGAAAVEDDGAREFEGEVELGEIEALLEVEGRSVGREVEADFADTEGGVVEEARAKELEVGGGGGRGPKGVDAERQGEGDGGGNVAEGENVGPVGGGGGVDVDGGDADAGGTFEKVGEDGAETGGLEMGVGVGQGGEGNHGEGRGDGLLLPNALAGVGSPPPRGGGRNSLTAGAWGGWRRRIHEWEDSGGAGGFEG